MDILQLRTLIIWTYIVGPMIISPPPSSYDLQTKQQQLYVVIAVILEGATNAKAWPYVSSLHIYLSYFCCKYYQWAGLANEGWQVWLRSSKKAGSATWDD